MDNITHHSRSIPNLTARGRDTFDPVAALAESKHDFGEHGGVNRSIECSSTFRFTQAANLPAVFQGCGTGYLYSRHYNPTLFGLGHEVAALEGMETGYPTASGMAAISCALLNICDSGDHIIASSTTYGGTHALLKEFFPRKCGIHTTFVDIADTAAVRAAITPRTRVLFTEALANPTLVVADLEALGAIADECGLTFVVDNTFTPLCISPARFGAEVVVHSVTKFINGASDLLAGVVCSSAAFLSSCMHLHTGSLLLLGPTLAPESAAHISMRLPHLGLRIKEHSRRALFLATRLEEHGLKVSYPGLASHPGHALFKKMMNDGYGFGGMLTLDVGSTEVANKLMEALQVRNFGFMAVSLGFSETLMSCSASTTSSEMAADELQRSGVSPGLVRFSIGITGSDAQRWQQFKESLCEVGLITEVTTTSLN